MVLMGGPIDTRANPTKVNHFAMAHSLEWPGGGERYGAEMPDHHGVGHLHCHLRQVGGRQRRRDGERRTDLRGDGRAIESHDARTLPAFQPLLQLPARPPLPRPGLRAEGCWTFNARDEMPRSSRPTAHPPTIANAPTATRVIPRKRVRCVPGMLNSSELKVLYPTRWR